ncbi:putative Dual specificity testis-specific protein [Naja naja]|nr:putative Dual specificity testis-specific protein [Naja naja]
MYRRFLPLFVCLELHFNHSFVSLQYINCGNLEQLLDSNQHLSWSVRVKLALDILAFGLSYLHYKGIFHRDLTSKYINCGNLEQLLDSNQHLSWSVRVKLALDIALGLSYLHYKGIFHRDLTSKNCLIKNDENGYSAIVGDFGLAEKIPDYSEKLPVADVFSYGIILCEIIARIQADPDYLPRTENFGLDYDAFQHMVGDCPPNFLQLAFNCCNLRPSFTDIVKTLEEILSNLKREEDERERKLLNLDAADRKPISVSKGLLERGQGIKRLSSLDDKIPPKSPRPRRNIWLSRSQSDIFSRKPSRKINVQDPYYTPSKGASRKVNPFNSREDLKGGKIKFFDLPSKSVISLVFDLHSPEARGCLKMSQPLFKHTYAYDWQDSYFLPARRSRSLPVSPEFVHKDYNTFGDLSSTVSSCDPTQLGAEVRQRLLCSNKYGVSEIPPFQVKQHRQDSHPPLLQEEEMDCSDELEPPNKNGYSVKCSVEEPELGKPEGQVLQDTSGQVANILVHNLDYPENQFPEMLMSCTTSEEMEVEDETQRNMPSTKLESSKRLLSINPSSQQGRDSTFLEVVNSDTSNVSLLPADTSASISGQPKCDI